MLLFKSLSWVEKSIVFNQLHKTMVKKPDSEKRRFKKSDKASILQAHLRGDASYEDAIELLRLLKKKNKKR